VQGALVFLMLLWALGQRLPLGFDLAWVGSVLWKQNTALFLPLMVRLKRWRAILILALLLIASTGPYFLLYPGSLNAFLRNLSGEAPWFQLGNLGFRQLVFDAMWSVGDVLQAQFSSVLYVRVQQALVVLFIAIPLTLLLLDRRPNVLTHLSLWMTAYFLIYHHVWEHHYVMLLPVMIGLAMRHESWWLCAIYLLVALPTPFYLIDPQGQVAVLDAMRWTPIRPLWQDLWYHASKALPTLLLYGLLAGQVLRSAARTWRNRRSTPAGVRP